MYLTGHIYTLNNTGAPNYTICNQGTSVLSFTNLNFKLSISKDNSVVTTLINTNDLSTLNLGTLPYGTINYGDYDINFLGFSYNAITGSYVLETQVYVAGTTNIVTWEKFNVTIQISKTGYQSFTNTFEFYNYDVGNDITLGFLGNTDFDIILINNTNNLDINGNQTKAASNFIALRKPFTDQVYFYNMIGTQGSIVYSDTNTLAIIGVNNYGIVTATSDINIQQKITLSNADNCTQQKYVNKKIWFPQFNPVYTPPNSCNDCVNNLSQLTISYSLDASNTSVFKIQNVNYFLSQFMDEKVIIETYDYAGIVVNTNTTTVNLTYSLWIANPSTFLTPINYNITPTTIGDNVIKVTHNYNALDISLNLIKLLYQCYNSYLVPTCNWWTVTANEECNSYKINNCNAVNISLDLQKLNDDKTYTTISTTVINAFTSIDISFTTDGVYVLKVNKVGNVTFEYYTLPIYCNVQDCLLKYLKSAICDTQDANCKNNNYYDFNAFLITAHTYFLLLNKELNYNFVYSTISASKTDELYTLSTFITKFDDYCSCNSTCNCSSCNAT